VLITDKNKTTVKKAYTALCARPTSYWALDYEPDLGGSFRKTADGDLLEIPKQELADLAKLPEPTDNDLTPIPAQKAVTPVASKTEGSYETSVTVTLSSETSGAFIHYTTNGNTPTASSTLYSSPITITNTATLKAIAVSAGMDNSTIMTETYTITDPPLQTNWGFFRSGSNIVVKDDRNYIDYINLKTIAAFKASEAGYNWDYGGFQNFDLTRLKAAGYTVIYIWLSYGAKPIDDGNIELSLRKGLTGSGTEWFSRSEDYPGYDWGNRAYDKRISIDDFSTEFTMTWSASGGSSDDWELGHRAVFFTALKE
jgi:hypothetical protein